MVLLAAVLVCVMLGLVINGLLLSMAAGLSLVIVLGIIWPHLALWGLKGSLCFSQTRCAENQSVLVTLELTNRWPIAAWMVMVREQSDCISAIDNNLQYALEHVPGWRKTQFQWTWEMSCRGVVPRASMILECGFPLGLWTFKKRLPVENKLVVRPRTLATGSIPEAALAQRDDGWWMSDRAGHSGDLLGVRPYRRGDSIRRIHWAQTARHDRLIICEMQSYAQPLIHLHVDARQEVHAGLGGSSSREWALRIAASLAQSWLHEGAAVSLSIEQQQLPAATGSKQLDLLLDLLSLFDQPGIKLHLPSARTDQRKAMQIIITTDNGILSCATSVAGPKHYLVLISAGFDEQLSTPQRMELPLRPWLTVESPAYVPEILQRVNRLRNIHVN
ncbi:MAG: hypothetical protein HJJLKODD_00157 [Phycisphaerae bacterium]|nr:hypothetical protein [Phycisphaerae bacterium]